MLQCFIDKKLQFTYLFTKILPRNAVSIFNKIVYLIICAEIMLLKGTFSF